MTKRVLTLFQLSIYITTFFIISCEKKVDTTTQNNSIINCKFSVGLFLNILLSLRQLF